MFPSLCSFPSQYYHSYSVCLCFKEARGAWVAQSVKSPTSAQVMISRFVGLSPASGSVLTAQSLKPASDSVSPSLSLCPSLAHALSLSLSLKNKHKKKKTPSSSSKGKTQSPHVTQKFHALVSPKRNENMCAYKTLYSVLKPKRRKHPRQPSTMTG